MSLKRVLVTGGAGYIGSHTAKALATHGFEPVVLDNLSSGHRWAVRWGPLVEGNMADQELVKTVINRHRIEGVIHFAANAYVGESMEQPRKYFHNNVANTLSPLHAIIDCGIQYVVFSSSCATYGVPQRLPIDEDHPQAPVNPYGESKLFVERALGWYGRIHGIRFVCLRYFNASGADPEGEIGERHDPETHIIPLAIQAAQNGHPALKIFGADYDTPDGAAVRDYVHVSDLAIAHVRALFYLARGGPSSAMNLGTGAGRSVRDIQRAIERISGRAVPACVCERRPGDPAILVAKLIERASSWDGNRSSHLKTSLRPPGAGTAASRERSHGRFEDRWRQLLAISFVDSVLNNPESTVTGKQFHGQEIQDEKRSERDPLSLGAGEQCARENSTPARELASWMISSNRDAYPQLLRPSRPEWAASRHRIFPEPVSGSI